MNRIRWSPVARPVCRNRARWIPRSRSLSLPKGLDLKLRQSRRPLLLSRHRQCNQLLLLLHSPRPLNSPQHRHFRWNQRAHQFQRPKQPSPRLETGRIHRLPHLRQLRRCSRSLPRLHSSRRHRPKLHLRPSRRLPHPQPRQPQLQPLRYRNTPRILNRIHSRSASSSCVRSSEWIAK